MGTPARSRPSAQKRVVRPLSSTDFVSGEIASPQLIDQNERSTLEPVGGSEGSIELLEALHRDTMGQPVVPALVQRLQNTGFPVVHPQVASQGATPGTVDASQHVTLLTLLQQLGLGEEALQSFRKQRMTLQQERVAFEASHAMEVDESDLLSELQVELAQEMGSAAKLVVLGGVGAIEGKKSVFRVWPSLWQKFVAARAGAIEAEKKVPEWSGWPGKSWESGWPSERAMFEAEAAYQFLLQDMRMLDVGSLHWSDPNHAGMLDPPRLQHSSVVLPTRMDLTNIAGRGAGGQQRRAREAVAPGDAESRLEDVGGIQLSSLMRHLECALRIVSGVSRGMGEEKRAEDAGGGGGDVTSSRLAAVLTELLRNAWVAASPLPRGVGEGFVPERSMIELMDCLFPEKSHSPQVLSVGALLLQRCAVQEQQQSMPPAPSGFVDVETFFRVLKKDKELLAKLPDAVARASMHATASGQDVIVRVEDIALDVASLANTQLYISVELVAGGEAVASTTRPFSCAAVGQGLALNHTVVISPQVDVTQGAMVAAVPGSTPRVTEGATPRSASAPSGNVVPNVVVLGGRDALIAVTEERSSAQVIFRLMKASTVTGGIEGAKAIEVGRTEVNLMSIVKSDTDIRSTSLRFVDGRGSTVAHQRVSVLAALALKHLKNVRQRSYMDTFQLAVFGGRTVATSGVKGGGGAFQGLMATDSFVLYDAAKNAWFRPETQGKAPSPRWGHSAVFVQHEMILFAGTDGKACFNDVHMLNVEHARWTSPSVQGTAPSERHSHTATLLPWNPLAAGTSDASSLGGNGRHLVALFGGRGNKGLLGDLHVLAITPTRGGRKSMAAERKSAAATRPREGEEEDGVQLRWLPKDALHVSGSEPTPRSGHCAAALLHGSEWSIYVFGGRAHVAHPTPAHDALAAATATGDSAADNTNAGSDPGAALMLPRGAETLSNELYVLRLTVDGAAGSSRVHSHRDGGRESTSSSSAALQDGSKRGSEAAAAEEESPLHLRWSLVETTGSTPPPREGASLACVGHKLVLLLGWVGNEHSPWVRDCYLLDTRRCVWCSLQFNESFPSARYAAAASLVDYRHSVASQATLTMAPGGGGRAGSAIPASRDGLKGARDSMSQTRLRIVAADKGRMGIGGDPTEVMTRGGDGIVPGGSSNVSVVGVPLLQGRSPPTRLEMEVVSGNGVWLHIHARDAKGFAAERCQSQFRAFFSPAPPSQSSLLSSSSNQQASSSSSSSSSPSQLVLTRPPESSSGKEPASLGDPGQQSVAASTGPGEVGLVHHPGPQTVQWASIEPVVDNIYALSFTPISEGDYHLSIVGDGLQHIKGSPVLVHVVGGPPHPPACLAMGAALSTCRVDRLESIKVVLHDAMGNRAVIPPLVTAAVVGSSWSPAAQDSEMEPCLSVSVKTEKGRDVPVTVTCDSATKRALAASRGSVGDAAVVADASVYNHVFTATFKVQEAGSHRLSVKVFGKDVPGSPFTVRTQAGGAVPSKCSAAGRGLRGRWDAGVTAKFSVTARDVFGNVKATGGDVFVLQYKEHGCDWKSGEVVDRGNGIYTMSYTPTVAGPCELRVFGDDLDRKGEDIGGSPFMLEIVPAELSLPHCRVLRISDAPLDASGSWGQVAKASDGPGPMAIVAGASVVFRICPRDAHANPVKRAGLRFRTRIGGPSNVDQLASIQEAPDDSGDFLVHFTSTAEGTYNLVFEGQAESRTSRSTISRSFSLPTAKAWEKLGSGSLQTVRVGAGAIDPKHCTATGEGLYESTLRKPTQFTIQSRDAFGNFLTTGGEAFQVRVQTGTDIPAEVTDNRDGTYTVRFTPGQDIDYLGATTNYCVSVTLRGEHIAGSPFVNAVKPVATSARLTDVLGVPDVMTAGEPYEFTIAARDEEGRAKLQGMENFTLEFQGRDERTGMSGWIKDLKNGTYRAYMVATDQSTSYKVSIAVKLDGVHVSASPYAVTVVPPGLFNLRFWESSELLGKGNAEVMQSFSAHGLGLAFAVAGEVTSFEVQSRAAFAAPVPPDQLSVELRGPEFVKGTIEGPSKTGVYEAKYCCHISGTYAGVVKYKRYTIQGCPFDLQVSAAATDPAACRVAWGTVTHLKAGMEGVFIIEARDRFGNVSACLQDMFKVFVRGGGTTTRHNKREFEKFVGTGTVTNKGDGNVRVSLMIPIGGCFSVTITHAPRSGVVPMPIQGSPFQLQRKTTSVRAQLERASGANLWPRGWRRRLSQRRRGPIMHKKTVLWPPCSNLAFGQEHPCRQNYRRVAGGIPHC
eukprot:jgi/Mesvir1/200/Mv13549-RA.2